MISGQDLGPGTAIVCDGEYEWEHKIAREHLPALTRLLGAAPDVDILDELAANWSGPEAADLERLIRESGLPVVTWTHSG